MNLILNEAITDDIRRLTSENYLGTEVSFRSLKAGESSSVLLVLDERKQQPLSVLKIIHDRAWLAREPNILGQEATILEALEFLPIRFRLPRLITYASSEENHSSFPMLLMSWLPGDPGGYYEPQLSLRLSSVAQTLRHLHDLHSEDLPASVFGRFFRHYANAPSIFRAPHWSARTQLWERAIEAYFSVSLDDCDSLLHRDFHVENVLFHRSEVSAILDWTRACLGNCHADVGHMRFNLTTNGSSYAADEFTKCYFKKRTCNYNPMWDLVAAVGAIPDLKALPGPAVGRLESFVEKALYYC